jgi:uncharacterized membrane protein YhaH (DUF805 family)
MMPTTEQEEAAFLAAIARPSRALRRDYWTAMGFAFLFVAVAAARLGAAMLGHFEGAFISFLAALGGGIIAGVALVVRQQAVAQRVWAQREGGDSATGSR